ncbi:MAG: hypothetical protein V2A79_18880 [Planctomycetota bacterium]
MKPTFIRMSLLLVLPALLAAGLLGCMKRKETITVARDGGVTMRVECETDAGDEFTNGDAMPSEEDGWTVKQWTVTERNDATGEIKEHYQLAAEKTFPPRARLADRFAPAKDNHAELYLQFPTTLKMEERPDGTYHHFRRVYPVRREWGRLEAVRKEIFKPVDERVHDKKVEEMTQEDRLLVLKALVRYEAAKMTTFARSAFLEVSPDAPQDGWLKVYAALQTVERESDYDRLASLLASPEEEDRTQALEAEAAAFESRTMGRMSAALADACGYSERQVARFTERYHYHKQYQEISEDLGDESFEITVEMPGEIVGTNADEVEGNQARWKFDAQVLRDRDFDSMVTSRVAK